ncbi:unnamed protein product [Phyllotreta striolata]|uniref:DNA/RNA non-specific endonuclease/pyrophosphatase/phosphodiesterase domain-containing protein n=1 Tax=Phyllotreta striolata TaxID=444603 RepID=A0A9N9TGQ8_PHYSR|nr:unnamed protein product [Phyllotreta striolata]
MACFRYLSTSLFLLTVLWEASAQDCQINPFQENAPLLVHPENTTIIYPDHGNKYITLKAGQSVKFACPQSRVNLGGDKSIPNQVTAVCVSDTQFKVNGATADWNSVSCDSEPVPTGRLSSSSCAKNARLGDIGFPLGADEFLKIITICFDTVQQTALYSYYDLTRAIGSRGKSPRRPQFAEDRAFYKLNGRTVNQLYLRKTQRKTVNELLGLDDYDTRYIKNGELYFLARGHLTAYADFIYPALQKATCRYINAAPQWQTFNGYNWERAESDTRNFADSRNVDLKVWTGTYGVTTLPSEETDEDIKLYLYSSGSERGIPVPAIYWKLVYEPITKRAIVLIGVNNPYETEFSKYVICPDVSRNVDWLDWRATDLKDGYSYACTLSTFRKVVTYAPNLQVTGLLE